MKKLNICGKTKYCISKNLQENVWRNSLCRLLLGVSRVTVVLLQKKYNTITNHSIKKLGKEKGIKYVGN